MVISQLLTFRMRLIDDDDSSYRSRRGRDIVSSFNACYVQQGPSQSPRFNVFYLQKPFCFSSYMLALLYIINDYLICVIYNEWCFFDKKNCTQNSTNQKNNKQPRRTESNCFRKSYYFFYKAWINHTSADKHQTTAACLQARPRSAAVGVHDI